MNLKRTENFEDHVLLGAKMVPFAGYEMPVQYKGISIEHNAVRNSVGIFDVSHMGEFIVKGKGAFELIQKVTSNDISVLKEGDAQYSCMPNLDGGIIDDLLVYNLGSDSYMLVVNASNIDKDWNWIQSQNHFGAELHNISDRTALLAVQGPKAEALLQKFTSVDLSGIRYYTFKRGVFDEVPNVILSATGYTGAGGFELYFENVHARKIWKSLIEAGPEFGLEPAGLGARDTLRLEMGFCLYGNDIDDTTNPLEAGLGWITKLKKDFTASDKILKIKQEGLKRKLVGFEMLGPSIPRSHYKIKNDLGEEIGEVRSGTQSPSLKIGIGLGYVDMKYLESGKPIFIDIRGQLQEAKIMNLPFLKKPNA